MFDCSASGNSKTLLGNCAVSFLSFFHSQLLSCCTSSECFESNISSHITPLKTQFELMVTLGDSASSSERGQDSTQLIDHSYSNVKSEVFYIYKKGVKEIIALYRFFGDREGGR